MQSEFPIEKNTGPLEMSPQQREVFDALMARETRHYRLSNWYQGVLYALNNPTNPDCLAQAAHSMRELIEKIPRVFASDAQGGPPDFKGRRRELLLRFTQDTERYPDGWKGCEIDARLSKTLKKTVEYLELSKQPSRREQIQKAVEETDPLAGQLNQKTRNARKVQFFDLWSRLEKIAHHQFDVDLDEIKECLEVLEEMVLDLLSPIAALDQQEISSILRRFDGSDSDARRMLSLIERGGENYDSFFRHVSDSAWIPILEKAGYFSNPPNWLPIRYLSSVAKDAPNEVIPILQRLPHVDDSWILYGIFETALQLNGSQSVRLRSKVLEYVPLESQTMAHRFPSLLAHWTLKTKLQRRWNLQAYLSSSPLTLKLKSSIAATKGIRMIGEAISILPLSSKTGFTARS